MKYCGNCGSKLEKESIYCSGCGKKVSNSSHKEVSASHNDYDEKLGLFDTYIHSIKNYIEFDGRASRREFWNFMIFNWVIYFFLVLFEVFVGINPTGEDGVFSVLFSLFTIIPSISISVRRIHDTGREGWWILLPFINLILAFTKGDNGDNQYGEEPIF